MSISQVKLTGNLRAIAEYFLDVDAALGDYYLAEDGSAEAGRPRALGGLGERLGLGGPITREQLLRILDGRHPVTGKRLIPFRKDRAAGVDQTASAPKTVSIAWAVGEAGERDAVERSQDTAVTTLVEYMRRRCALVRDRGEPQLAKNVLAVAVNHQTSRQTAEQSLRGTGPDPQMHTHIIWAMAERADGRVCAIYRDQIFERREEWEAAYHCGLATELARAGFPIRRMTGKGGRYFEIDGIPEKLVKRWSGRAAEVSERMEVAAARFREWTGRKATNVELRQEVVRSRSRKVHAHKTDLLHYWPSIAGLEGVTPGGIGQLRRTGRVPAEAEGRAIVTAELLGPDGLTKQHATFSTRDLYVAALRRAAGLLDVGQTERLVHDLQRSGELRLTGEDRWTTRRMWEQERHVFAWHGERTGTAGHRPATSGAQLLRTLARHSPAAGKASRLSVEQLEVLRQMLSQRTTAVRGWAGTGKGTVASAAGEVWRSENRRVMAVAVAGKKAADLASDLGEGTEHLTVAQFLSRSDSGRLRLRDTDVIVLDEASMVSTDQWAALATAIGTTATVVLLGDEAQLPAINAGGLWPFLARGGPELTEVHRTRSVWEREATADLRHGRSTAAFTAYAAHNRVRLARTRAESLEAAVHDWARDGHTGLLITDATNAERDWLNGEAQRHRLLAGELGADAVTVLRAGSSLALHAGDRVIFGATYWPGAGARVENGTTAIVETVDVRRGTVTVQTGEPARGEITLPAATAPLALHYAVHVYKAQGDTVDRAYVITGGWQTSKESLYVACTRARDATRLYLDKETLGRDIDAEAIAVAAARGGRSRAKVAATPHPQDSGTADDRYAKAAARLRRVQRRRKLRRRRADRRPFTERYRLRKKRQDELFEGRLRRQGEEMRRRRRGEVPRPTLDTIAAIQGVPVWALETAEIVTGRSYVAEHVFHQATGRSLGI